MIWYDVRNIAVTLDCLYFCNTLYKNGERLLVGTIKDEILILSLESLPLISAGWEFHTTGLLPYGGCSVRVDCPHWKQRCSQKRGQARRQKYAVYARCSSKGLLEMDVFINYMYWWRVCNFEGQEEAVKLNSLSKNCFFHCNSLFVWLFSQVWVTTNYILCRKRGLCMVKGLVFSVYAFCFHQSYQWIRWETKQGDQLRWLNTALKVAFLTSAKDFPRGVGQDQAFHSDVCCVY